VKPSHEYAASIVKSVVTGEPSVIYGNVLNRGLTPAASRGLRGGGPRVVDWNGLQPTAVPDIPPQLIGSCGPTSTCRSLTVQALLTRTRSTSTTRDARSAHGGGARTSTRSGPLVEDELLLAHGAFTPACGAPEGVAVAA
jgi:alpha-galactosidase